MVERVDEVIEILERTQGYGRPSYSVDVEKFVKLQEFWDLLEMGGISEPTLVHYNIEIPANYSGAATISLPEDRVCPQRVFDVWSERPKYTKYGWRIDSETVTGKSVPKHFMVPNENPYTERNVWGKRWVKYHFLYYEFENTHDTDSIVHRPTAWAQFIPVDRWNNLLEPFLWAKIREILTRGEWMKTGEVKLPEIPPKIPTPRRSKIPEADPTYRCLECGSVLEIDFDEGTFDFMDQMAHEGSGRAQYQDPHPDCPLLSPTRENLERALDEGEIEEV